MADYNVLAQTRPFDAAAAIGSGQQLRANNMLMQQQEQQQQRAQQFNALLGDYLGQGTVNTLTGGGGAPMDGAQFSLPGGGEMPANAPPPSLNQLFALDPERAMQVQQFVQAQQAAQQQQVVQQAHQAITKAQFVLDSKEPGELVRTAFPEVWQQLEQMGEDPETFTPEKWRDEASQMIAHYGPIAGVGPQAPGEGVTLSQGQKRFERGRDGQLHEVASVAPSESDKDPNDKTFTRATSLRKEYDSKREGFETIRSAWENVQNAEKGDAGDTQLVLNYMRVISPGIRIQPGQTIDDAASVPGVPQGAIGLWNKIVGGGKLNDSQRAELRSQARRTFGTQERLASEARDQYTELATRAGVDPADVVGQDTRVREFKTEAEAEAAGLKPGTRITVGGRPAVWE